MDKICDSAKFYSNIGLNYIVAKIKITKYNHLHQSYFVDISYCDINIINLLRSISHDILRNGSGGRGSRGSKPTLPTPNKYFLMNSGRKKGRNRRQMFTFFYIVDTCEAVQKHWIWHYLFRRLARAHSKFGTKSFDIT